QTGNSGIGSALHEAYGVFASSGTCGTNKYCQMSTNLSRWNTTGYNPAQTSPYHPYGRLHVPATATNRGQLVAYLDDVQVGGVQTYAQYAAALDGLAPQVPSNLPATSSSACVAIGGTLSGGSNCNNANNSGLYPNITWLYGIRDLNHYAIILG